MATDASHPRLVTRDGWRFSLRALLVMLFIAAIPLAWVSHWRSKKLREHAAAKRLRELGLIVKERRPDLSPGSRASAEPWYALLLPPDHTNQVSWVQANFSQTLDATGIRLISDLPNLRRLQLPAQNNVPDVSLAPLRSLPQLEILTLGCSAENLPYFLNQHSLSELHLCGSGITDSCSQLLENNPRLTAVFLLDTATSDELAPHIARLEDLTFLQLIHSKISSQGISQLSSLKKLRQLLLVGKEIDDAAVPAIAQLKTLRYLSVHKTSISAAGIEQLRAALPNCKFE